MRDIQFQLSVIYSVFICHDPIWVIPNQPAFGAGEWQLRVSYRQQPFQESSLIGSVGRSWCRLRHWDHVYPRIPSPRQHRADPTFSEERLQLWGAACNNKIRWIFVGQISKRRTGGTSRSTIFTVSVYSVALAPPAYWPGGTQDAGD